MYFPCFTHLKDWLTLFCIWNESISIYTGSVDIHMMFDKKRCSIIGVPSVLKHDSDSSLSMYRDQSGWTLNVNQRCSFFISLNVLFPRRGSTRISFIGVPAVVRSMRSSSDSVSSSEAILWWVDYLQCLQSWWQAAKIRTMSLFEDKYIVLLCTWYSQSVWKILVCVASTTVIISVHSPGIVVSC